MNARSSSFPQRAPSASDAAVRGNPTFPSATRASPARPRIHAPTSSATPTIRALADQPFGPGLLLLLAGGLGVFAVYCLFDARYRTE